MAAKTRGVISTVRLWTEQPQSAEALRTAHSKHIAKLQAPPTSWLSSCLRKASSRVCQQGLSDERERAPRPQGKGHGARLRLQTKDDPRNSSLNATEAASLLCRQGPAAGARGWRGLPGGAEAVPRLMAHSGCLNSHHRGRVTISRKEDGKEGSTDSLLRWLSRGCTHTSAYARPSAPATRPWEAERVGLAGAGSADGAGDGPAPGCPLAVEAVSRGLRSDRGSRGLGPPDPAPRLLLA